MAQIIHGKYWNSYAVRLPHGEVIPCHNMASARKIRNHFNERSMSWVMPRNVA